MKKVDWENYNSGSEAGGEVRVRVCKNCGTVYSEKTGECIPCSERLGEPMNLEEAEKLGSEIRISKGSKEPSYEVLQMKKKLAGSGRLSAAALGIICVDIIAYTIALFTGVSLPQNIETPAMMIVCAMMLLLIVNLVFCFAPEIVFRTGAEKRNNRNSSTKSDDALVNSGVRGRKSIDGAFRFSGFTAFCCVALPIICSVFALAVLAFYLYHLL